MLSAPAPGLYESIYMFKIKKKMYKIRFQRDFFKLVAKDRGYIHMVKHEKNVYKIGLESIFFKPATNGQSDKGFLLTSKLCSQGVACPCPGAIYIYKIIKNVYKIRFLSLHLQRMGKVVRGFCWHQKFAPKGLYALARGYIHMEKT